MEIEYLFVRKFINEKQMFIVKEATETNLANIGTKSLGMMKLGQLHAWIGVRDESEDLSFHLHEGRPQGIHAIECGLNA
eukprot:11625824-Heterocapsa_arctica.AAC.1